MFGRIKEKLRYSVWKTILVKKIGTVTAEINGVSVTYPEYRVVAIKYVSPKKKEFKHKIEKVKRVFKNQPNLIAYSNKETRVNFMDVDSGDLVKLGGGTVAHAKPSEQAQVEEDLIKTGRLLLRSKQELMLVIFALVAGVGLGYIICNLGA